MSALFWDLGLCCAPPRCRGTVTVLLLLHSPTIVVINDIGGGRGGLLSKNGEHAHLSPPRPPPE